MRLYTRRYEENKEDSSGKQATPNWMQLEPDYEGLFREIERRFAPESYEEDYERARFLPEYLKLAVAFSEAYEVDMSVDSEIDGVSVRFCLQDSAMPEEMTRIFGRLVTCSSSLCTWTHLEECDLVFELKYRTHKLKQSKTQGT